MIDNVYEKLEKAWNTEKPIYCDNILDDLCYSLINNRESKLYRITELGNEKYWDIKSAIIELCNSYDFLSYKETRLKNDIEIEIIFNTNLVK